ncbi:MAG: hypothetical protein KAH32_01130 [Chlamydiia bacterium]|nr:hypothetical protein [Chlamydiia bacterium]
MKTLLSALVILLLTPIVQANGFTPQEQQILNHKSASPIVLCEQYLEQQMGMAGARVVQTKIKHIIPSTTDRSVRVKFFAAVVKRGFKARVFSANCTIMMPTQSLTKPLRSHPKLIQSTHKLIK